MPASELKDWTGVEVPVGGELVLLPAGGERLFLLNETAREVWTGLREGDSAAVVRRLVHRYGIGNDRATRDIEAAIRCWRAEGLFGSEDAGAASRAELSPPGAEAFETSPPSGTRRSYRLGDLLFSLAADDPHTGRVLHAILGHLEAAGAARPNWRGRIARYEGAYRMHGANGVDVRERDQGEFIVACLRELNIQAAKAARPVMVLHAAAFGRDGQAIVMPGPGGRGKSTLVAEMALAGYDYLGDDMVAVLPHSHELAPLPTALNLKPGSLGPLTRRHGALPGVVEVQAGAVDYRFMKPPVADVEAKGPWHIAGLVFPCYTSGHSTALLRMAGGEVLRAISDSTVAFLRGRGDAALEQLLAWLAQVPAWSMQYDGLGNGREAVEQIFEMTAAQGARQGKGNQAA